MTPRLDHALAPSATAARPPRRRARSLRALVVRLASPLVWRSPARMASKLAEFGATEAGSALDMLRAAELTDDARLRRLFFRHALDEAGHARLFRDAARALDPAGCAPLDARAQAHARRQDLFAELGPEAFLAFVHLAEQRGETHFLALVDALGERRPDLAATFEGVARDERFHISYSGRDLARLAGADAARHLRGARLDAAWAAYKRAGRGVAERIATLLLIGVYFLLLPPFAIAQRLLDPQKPGWKVPARRPAPSLERARRQAR